MIKRLDIRLHDAYEQNIARNLAIKIMVDFAEGRKHDFMLGTEDLELETWDDIAIEKASGVTEHIQIKHANSTRLGTENDECERNTYITGARRGHLRDLSEFDKVINSLGIWFRTATAEQSRKQFRIILPGQAIEIKNGFSVAHFKSFIDNMIKKDGSSVNWLNEALEHPDGSLVRNADKWLKSWCGFQNVTEIFETLKFLDISSAHTSEEINESSRVCLLRIVKPDRIIDAESRIFKYLYEDLGYSDGVTPRRLLNQIHDLLRHDIPHWTLFELEELECKVSGICDFNNVNEIERPEFIIKSHWDDAKASKLLVNSNSHSDYCSLSASLARIALHKRSQTGAHCRKPEDITRIIFTKSGRTLGTSIDDLDGIRIPQLDDVFKSGEQKPYASSDEMHTLANELHLNMSLYIWPQIKSNINEMIRRIPALTEDSLKSSVERLWSSWKSEFKEGLTEQSKDNIKNLHNLLCRILKPEAERSEVDAQIRVGLKTVKKLSHAIFMQLIVSACIPDKISNEPVCITDKAISTLGLEYWSGPNESSLATQKVEETSVSIIGRNTSSILIFSEVTSPETYLEHKSLASSSERTNSIADGRNLKAVITNSRAFRGLVEKGSLSELRNHLLAIVTENQVTVQTIGV